jgi:hypothetical protein
VLKKTPLLITFLFGLFSLASGQFVETTPDNLKNLGLELGDADWGDYDNDGDLDLLVIGITNAPYWDKSTTVLFENKNGALVEKTIGLPGVHSGSCDWGDFDNDGDLDILLMGLTGSNLSYSQLMQIYLNTDGTFALLESSVSQLPQISQGEARWVDVNNDGRQDIVCTGYNVSLGYPALPGVYEAIADGKFVRRFILTPAQGAKLDVGDFDSDGDIDLAVRNQVYRNDNNWNFTSVTKNFKPNLAGDVVLADVDNDGKLDLVVSGLLDLRYTYTPTTIVYQNQDTVFHPLTNSVPLNGVYTNGVGYAAAAMADYNNDGAPDLILSTPALNLLNNNGQGDFTNSNLSMPTVANIGSFAIKWADYDQDHRLDVYAESKLLRNANVVPNTPPNPPTLITIDSVYNNSVYLHWNNGSDNETAAQGLSYEIYVGTHSLQQDVVNSNSFLSTGKRKLAEPGALKAKKLNLNLPGGNYYFGVQSIDPAFEGSIFSLEVNAFVIRIESKGKSNCTGYNSAYVAKPSGSYNWSVEGGTIISGQGTDSIVVRWDVVGNGRIKASNSTGDKNTLLVLIGKKPLPKIVGDATVCTQQTGMSSYFSEDYTISDSLSYAINWSSTSYFLEGTRGEHTFQKVWTSAGKQKIFAQAFSKNGACFSYDTLLVDVDQRPSFSISGPQETCILQKDKYVTTAPSPIWKVINGNIISDSLQTIKVLWPNAANGVVLVSQSSARGYCVVKDSLNVLIDKGPDPLVLGNFNVCTEEVVKFITDAQNPLWEVNNGTIIWDSVQTIKVLWASISGSGSVTLTEVSKGRCPGYVKLPVTIHSYPDKPIVTRNGNQLRSSASPSGVYYWYLNKKLIKNETNRSIEIDQPGSYRVEVFNDSGCSVISDEFVVSIITDVSIEDTRLTLYPNPANERIVIEMANSKLGTYQLQVYSVLNTIVKQMVVQKNQFFLQQELDITELNPGMYILTLTNDLGSHMLKFIKL